MGEKREKCDKSHHRRRYHTYLNELRLFEKETDRSEKRNKFRKH